MRIVLTNVPPDQATTMARTLVEERLAACVNMISVRSVYRWEGALCDEPETTLLLKTADDRVEALRERIQALHPYSLPEIVVLEVDAARSLPGYVAWVRDETRPPA